LPISKPSSARLHFRHQHVVDFRHRHRRCAEAPRAPGRAAFLQPGAADGAGRGRFRTRHRPAIAETLFATAAAWGKTPVHARSTPGFIVNRVARPYYAEALRLAQEGAADCATIDAVMREAGGFRMGPFELMDMIGHDVNFAVTHSVWRAFFHDPRFLPSLLQQELVDAGLLGRKSGRGFYDYRDGAGAAGRGQRTGATRPRENRPLWRVDRSRCPRRPPAAAVSPASAGPRATAASPRPAAPPST
jgi:hypothetical protein